MTATLHPQCVLLSPHNPELTSELGFSQQGRKGRSLQRDDHNYPLITHLSLLLSVKGDCLKTNYKHTRDALNRVNSRQNYTAAEELQLLFRSSSEGQRHHKSRCTPDIPFASDSGFPPDTRTRCAQQLGKPTARPSRRTSGVLAKLTYQFPLFSLPAHLNKGVSAFFSSDRRNSRASRGLCLAVPCSPSHALRPGGTGVLGGLGVTAAQSLRAGAAPQGRRSPAQRSPTGALPLPHPGNSRGEQPGEVSDAKPGSGHGQHARRLRSSPAL